jgi:hypothetical protein
MSRTNCVRGRLSADVILNRTRRRNQSGFGASSWSLSKSARSSRPRRRSPVPVTCSMSGTTRMTRSAGGFGGGGFF